MALKVAINGFGRIGRCVARIALNRDDIELVAINDTAKIDINRYLLQYDTVHGEFNKKVSVVGDDYLEVDGKKIRVFSTRNPEELDFAKYGAEVILECTGAFLTMEKCEVHINRGMKRVIMSAPAKDDTPTFVMGVNEETYNGQKIISNASCTTNCLGPIAKILDDELTVEKGLMTTIHSYTHGQNLVDAKGRDKRRSRAAACNIIPTSTGAAKAINLVLPHLKGKMHGQSVRVPTPNVSMVDLNVVTKKDISKDELNDIFKSYSNNKLKGVLLVDEDHRVSSDFLGSSYSSVVVEDLTQVICGNLIKVMSWYDNEWGYSSRLLDLAIYSMK